VRVRPAAAAATTCDRAKSCLPFLLTPRLSQLALAGLILIGTLVHHNVKGGILIGMTLLTALVWSLNSSWPQQVFEWPSMELGPEDLVDFSLLSDVEGLRTMLPAIAAFVFIGIFDVSGVMFGLSALADLSERDGTIPGSLWAVSACERSSEASG
jgi:xanthine/uracil/vitamin C permease (AzgA family)